MSVGTAFYPRQRELNANQAWGEWAGYFAAAVYADFHDIEYAAIREAAAVIDIQPLYKYVISGPRRDAAARPGDHARRLEASTSTRSIYTPWCDDDGKVLDDGTITRLGEHEYRITAADPCYRWFRMNATGLDVDVEDVSEQLGALALQGKLSREVLEAATGEDWTDVRYFRHRRARIADVDVERHPHGLHGRPRLRDLDARSTARSPCGTGSSTAGEAYGIHAAGIRALDVARVEAGLILLDAEYTSARHALIPEQNYSPFELGLGRLVHFDKAAEFNGRRALLAEQRAGGPARRLVGLELDWAGVEGMFGRHGLARAHLALGRPSTGARLPRGEAGRPRDLHQWGTTIKKMVAFGSVDKAFEAPGTRLSVEYTVEGERGKVGATVVPLPFLDLERKRT